MKRFLIPLLFLLSAVAAAQVGPITINSSTSPCATIGVGPKGSQVAITVSGTFSATLQPELSLQGQAAANTQVTPSTSSTAQSTITSAGTYFTVNVAGADTFLLCVTSYVSGTATVYLNISTAGVAHGGGSGGSGTVTSVTFTGDGTVESSTLSTAVTTSGTVTATLATAAGGTVLNNATASSAAPTYTAAVVHGVDNSVAGSLQLANGSANAHTIINSGATTTNTIQGFAAVPTTGHLIDCTVSSTTCLLHDSGVVTANVLTGSSLGAGIARSAGSTQALTTAELSGDATTSGSNAVTLAHLNINATPSDYIAGGGTAQAQTATFSPALSANTTGAWGWFLPTAANTAAAPTLAVNSLTAKAITKCGTVALVANDLVTTAAAFVIYDGTEWVLQNPQAITCGVSTTLAWGSVLAGGGAATTKPTANATFLWAFTAPTTVISSSKLGYAISTADNTANLYNMAIFNTAGNIVCQTGAVAGTSFAPSTGGKTISWTSPCGPIIAGTRYYLAITNVTSTAVISGQSNTFSPYCGAVPATNSTTSSAVWTTPLTYSADSLTGVCASPTFSYY